MGLLRTTAGGATAFTLAGLAGLHLAWAAGAAWPAETRDDLAAEVVGADQVPSAAACAVVAGLLAVAAAATADAGGPRRAGILGRRAAQGAGVVLAGRGAVGLMAWPWMRRTRPRFAARDLRAYSPLCLLLAAGVKVALGPR